MNEVKFIVRYKNKDYEFQYGSEVYIFHTLLYNDVKCINKILKMIGIIQAAYLKDDDRTPLGALADYVAVNWKKVKQLPPRAVLGEFYSE